MNRHFPTFSQPLLLLLFLFNPVLPSSWAALLVRRHIPVAPATTHLKPHSPSKLHSVNALAFSTDGTMIATGGDIADIRLWDVRSGKVRSVFVTRGPVISLAFSPDAGLLTAASTDGTVRVWNIHSAVHKPCLIIQGYVASLAFSPDSKRIAGAEGQRIRLWNARTGKLEQSFWEASNGVGSVAFSPDGTRIASGGGNLKIWKVPPTTTSEQVPPAQTIQELETAQQQNLAMEHGTSAVTCVAFSPQGNVVASASNNTIGLWGVETGGLLRTLKAQGEIEEMAFSANGAMIAGSGQNGMIWVWKAETGMLVRKWRARSGAVKCVAFSPTEPLLATSWDKGAVLLWDVISGKLIRVLHEE